MLGKVRPDVCFGPTIYCMSSVLLHYVDEESCFNCMEMLLDGNNSTDFIIQTKIAYESSRHVLKNLTKKYAVSSTLNCSFSA